MLELAAEKYLAYAFDEINENASGHIFRARYGDRHKHRFEEIFTFLRSQFATEVRKIISLIKAKRNEGLEQLEILTACSRRDDVFVLKLILLFQQANARETWDDEFIIHSIGGVP